MSDSKHLIKGIHHITAIAGPAQENLDFYAGMLGMRLVKRSVNQDDPGTYHLFYADAAGNPGTDLTFFPWAQMAPGRKGYGLSTEVSLAVPPGSLDFWVERLALYDVDSDVIEMRFGERTLPLRDPHGLEVALVETGDPRLSMPWEDSPVDAEYQVRGLHSARLWERSLAVTERFLTGTMGFERVGEDGGWTRFAVADGGSGAVIDIQEVPEERIGQWGVGSIHHIAWRVAGDLEELAMRQQVIKGGAHPTEVIDRFWFKSVYFREPGGVLFELATDGPGFSIDEDATHLGEQLILPPWLEEYRIEIEGALPPLEMPTANAR